MTTPSRSKARKLPSKAAIRHSVATSTAIETGQSVHVVKQKIRSGKLNPHKVKLAD